MRLDSLGKPPLVQLDNVEISKPNKLKDVKIQEAKTLDDQDTSGHSQNSQRLGKIFDLLKRASKKHQYKGRANQALKIYQTMIHLDNTAKTGQTLDVRG